MSIALVIFTYAIWSSNLSIGKLILQNSSPLFATGLRMVLASLLILTYLFFKNRSQLKIRKKSIFPLLAISLSSIYITNNLEFWSLKYLTVGKTSFLFGLNFFFVPIFSYLYLQEKVNWKKGIGLLIGFTGKLSILFVKSENESLLKAFSLFSIPELVMVVAAISCAFGKIQTRVLVSRQEVSPLMINGYTMLLGGLFSLIHSLCVESWTPTPIIEGQYGGFFKTIFFMLLISNLFGFNMYGFLLKKYSATLLSFFSLLVPIFSSVYGWVLLGEPPSWVIPASTCIVAYGLFLAYRAEQSQGYISKAPLILRSLKKPNLPR